MRATAFVVLAVLLSACGTDGSGLPAVGTLERDRIEIVAEARETILQITVREGQAVRAGEIVARQEAARAEAAVARAGAALAVSQARLAELVRGPRREEITQARARLAGAESRQATDENEYARVAGLVDRKLASPSDLDAAFARRDLSRAERDTAAAALEALLEGTTVEELDQARAAADEARAVLEDARIALSRLTLRAPRDGTVDAIPYKYGDRPAAGATVVVLLADQAPYARVYVPQAVRARVAPGLAAVVTVEGVDGTFDGVVRYVSAEAAFTPYYALTERDRGRLTYVAEVVLQSDAARNLASGLPVEVDFPSLREPPSDR